jgi:hypothetical protein
MKQTTSQNQAQILKLLPELIQKATLAQTRLSESVTHFEITQDGVLKSTLAPLNGTQRFTPQFEEFSEVLLAAVIEIGENLLNITDTIEEIEAATSQLAVGVETQLKISPVASMRSAVSSLESTLRTRSSQSLLAVK